MIIGAGPAGLTAAYELLKTGRHIPVVIEKLSIPGGLSRTVNYKGNRLDIGGHRFFSKSDKVLDWWLDILPLENGLSGEIKISYQNKFKNVKPSTGAAASDEAMLLRDRKSRIYFLKKLFPYPIKLDIHTFKKLGAVLSLKILLSYIYSRVFPVRPENSLRDFLYNRFGKQLYSIFFKDYTRKVWGVDAEHIPAEWGKQRIKGVSVSKIIANSVKRKRPDDILQKNVETSLIQRFLYPKYGPGQLWEKVAAQVVSQGGRILYDQEVINISVSGDHIQYVSIRNAHTQDVQVIKGDCFISTMAIKDLVKALTPPVSPQLAQIAEGLEYREFISIGLLVKDLSLKEPDGKLISDNWIYIQEKGVKMGRLQIFNNWSPYMVNDKNTVWLGLEYFCQKDDELWSMPENELLKLAESELIEMGIVPQGSVLDGTVIKVEKAYPGYFGTYNQIGVLREYLDRFKNLFLVGRNGMHRYNNQDHSMLTAMEAVHKIINGEIDKASVWEINTEYEYQEESQ